MGKLCGSCNIEKALDNFYKNKASKDGMTRYCKDCMKLKRKKYYEKCKENPEWVRRDRKRNLEYISRMRKNPEWVEKKREYDRTIYKTKHGKEKRIKYRNEKRPWLKTYEYYKAYRRLNLPKGIEVHHWSYKASNLQCVFVLPRGEHKKLHKQLSLNERHLCFMVKKTGQLLDTRQKHLTFMKSIKVVPLDSFLVDNTK